MPNKHNVASVVFAALLGFSGLATAEFQIGAESGYNSANVDHSFDFAGGSFLSTGVSCGSIDEIEDGIGNPTGFYGQYTWNDDRGDKGHFGIRYGYYNAGDSTIQDLSVIIKSAKKDKAAFFGGIGVSKLAVDVEEFSLTGLCAPAGRQSAIFPAQEIEFSGFKFLLGYEKQIAKKLFWTVAGSYAFYDSAAIDTDDGFETTIEPGIFSLTVGLTGLF